ncbi:hypothetical protein L227DRAFT_508585 [Lentinus tigrinus ALCF2SS1-6]|uniref:F-box domain-containing protein n=1 Tax=Lentinus tigrinus ALCF2SS1-6 TaxID=1328759 RepID=A0A5C2RZD4_9APHY|nr:hypothetical protein L227DRAFT_508585 [Lentinus tigrinus ALCF2SS1-6]
MSTCRFLYREGGRMLLQNPVRLWTQRRLRSFLIFLYHAPHSRPHHLRDLSLSNCGVLPPTLAQWLGRICPLMTRLESLSITSDSEEMLHSDMSLVFALAKLESLQQLSLYRSGERVCTLLQLLHAPLKTITLSWHGDNSDADYNYWKTIDEDDWPSCHPTILLENFAETLEELTCAWWLTTEDYIRPHKTFPRLHRLIVDISKISKQFRGFLCLQGAKSDCT